MNKFIWIIVVALAAATGIGANWWWTQVETDSETLASSLMPVSAAASMTTGQGNYRSFYPPKNIASFELQEANSGGLTEHDLLDKWSFVVMGYTSCPDVCPTTLGRLQGVYQQLKQTADVQVIFVSADPLRDEVNRLQDYINYFEPEFRAVTTSHDRLFPFAQSLLLPYGIVARAPAADYAVSHSASIALINPQGKLQGQFKPAHQLGAVPVIDMKKMARQFRKIVANAERIKVVQN